MNLAYDQLHMDVQGTVIYLTGPTQYNIDGITKALWNHGIQSREALQDLPDTDLFWIIVTSHEIEVSV